MVANGTIAGKLTQETAATNGKRMDTSMGILRGLVGLAAIGAVIPCFAQSFPGRAGREPRFIDQPAIAPPPSLVSPAAPMVVPRNEVNRPERLSPEERRQLRHDIQEAGRGIYRRNPEHKHL